MITAEEFWKKMDEYRMGRAWNHIAEHLGLRYSTIISQRKWKQYPSFYYAVRLCDFFGIRLDNVIDVETLNTELMTRRRLTDTDRFFGNLFWMIVDDYRAENCMTWTMISEKINMPKTTVATVKSEKRTLSLDVTVRLMEILSIPLQNCVDYLCNESEIGSERVRTEKDETDTLRDEIISTLKGITKRENLIEIQRHAKYLKSMEEKNNPTQLNWI